MTAMTSLMVKKLVMLMVSVLMTVMMVMTTTTKTVHERPTLSMCSREASTNAQTCTRIKQVHQR